MLEDSNNFKCSIYTGIVKSGAQPGVHNYAGASTSLEFSMHFNAVYTHRQKLSNSKLVLNIKKCFVPKY